MEFKTEQAGFQILVNLETSTNVSSGRRQCNLCIEEKLCIMNADPTNLLNKRTQIFAKCRHRDKCCKIQTGARARMWMMCVIK